MIYTVTLNPSLDYHLSLGEVVLGGTNRSQAAYVLPGGKGINVSLMLKHLGEESLASGFLAGFTGEEIHRRLEECGVLSRFLRLSEREVGSVCSASRINVKLDGGCLQTDHSSISGTEFNAAGPMIGEEQQKALAGWLLRELRSEDILVLAGSIPASMPRDWYLQLMESLRQRGEGAEKRKPPRVVVDAEGEVLRQVLPCHPFLVKPNQDELAQLTGCRPETREEAAEQAEELRRLGAENVLVSMGAKGAVLAAEDGSIYSSPPPKGQVVEAVGSGDSMVAGFLHGYLQENSLEAAFYLGIAAGSASAFTRGLASEEEVIKRYRQLRGQ